VPPRFVGQGLFTDALSEVFTRMIAPLLRCKATVRNRRRATFMSLVIVDIDVEISKSRPMRKRARFIRSARRGCHHQIKKSPYESGFAQIGRFIGVEASDGQHRPATCPERSISGAWRTECSVVLTPGNLDPEGAENDT